MINTGEALELFAEEFMRIYGENEKLKPEDDFAVVLNNCVMRILVNKEGRPTITFIPDVIKINESLDIYCDSDNGT